MRRSPLRPEYEPGVLGNARLHGRKPEGVYMPPVKDVWQRYLRKFTKNGKLLDEERALAWLTRLPSPPHQRLPRR